MKRTFVESSVFVSRIKEFGGIGLLAQIQKAILENPRVGVLVEGTSGVRKFRIAKEGSGKSGGYRVFYLDLPNLGITHLLHIISKNEDANISDIGKNLMKKEVKRLKERKK